MNYLLFESHPGDMLTIKSHPKNIIEFQIANISLRLSKPVKLTPEGYKAFFDSQPLHQKNYLIQTLNKIVERVEIILFFIKE